MQRTKRIPAELGLRVLKRLKQSGELDVLLGMLEDHADHLDEQIRGMLSGQVFTEPKQFAAVQAYQGALQETRRISATWHALATKPIPEETPREMLDSRGGASVNGKPPRVGL